MADYLPPVVARLSMDMGDFMAGIAKAKAALKGLSGDFRIGTDGLDAAAAKVAALSKALQGLNGTVRVNADGLGNLAAKTAAAGERLGYAGRSASDAGNRFSRYGLTVNTLADDVYNLDRRADGTVGTFAKTAAAATAGAAGFRIWGTGIRVAGNALHWIISGLAEFAAVAIPAIVALAAGMAVMAPAAVNAAQHMQALAVATSASNQMFGQTIGSVLGFSGALQSAQDAARPAVFGILGSALITAKEGMGGFATAGLQVTQMLQAFGAKVAVDFGPGGALAGGHLFKNMATDLQGLGQVLGNVGHAFLNFANAMPGLAEFLLKGLSGITGFISSLSGAAPILITVGFGLEELVRWGGLAVSILARVGSAAAGLMKLAGFGAAATEVKGLSMALQDLAKTTLGKFQIAGVVAAVAAVSFLIYKLATAKNAAQQFGDALQASLMKVSNVNAIGQISNNIATLTQKAAAAPRVLNGSAESMMRFGNAAQTANPEIASFGNAIKQQTADMKNVVQGAALLARTYGTTFVGALALADQANVKLAAGITGTGTAALQAQMQVRSLVQGYQAMGQSSGQVGADMTALAIQSGLAATGVSKLNSAWDDFTGNLTGGTTALAGLGTDLTGLATGVTKITNVLGKAGNVSLSVKQFADSLKSFSGAGATAWQNWGQAIGKGQAMLDWLRTAGAEGAVSAKQFKQAGLDIASAFVPLAASSKTAQSELMGLVQQIDPSITSFSQLKSAIAGSGASFSGLGGIVGGATQKMAVMSSVAQTLGTTLQSALVSALQSAQVTASGAGAAMQQYAQDLMSGAAGAQKASGDYHTLMGDLEKLGLSAQQAAALIAQVTQNLNSVPRNVTSTIHIMTVGSVPSNYGISGRPDGTTTGHAAGTPSAPSGWAWVGEAGPELVKFRGGETVLPNQVSMGFANGTGGPYGGDIHIYLDGRELNAAISQRAIQTQRRTGTNQMQKRTR